MNSEELESHPLVRELWSKFSPLMEARAKVLGEMYPNARFHLYQASIGSLTPYQGYGFGLECLFPQDVPGRGDGLGIDVSVCHLDGAPRIHADVSWGNSEHAPPDDPIVGAALDERMPEDFCTGWTSSDAWPAATPEILARLESDFPRLMKGFEDVVAFSIKVISQLGS
ncbi:MAG: hypothetical protein HYY18_06395 [Planctomycetes bacterium]|nr:hypothetical protein [Planctomycetota bacterium]